MLEMLDTCVCLVLVVLDACVFSASSIRRVCVCLVLVVLDVCVFRASSIRRVCV